MNPLGEQDPVLADDPLWYRDAIIYELHVRSFQDSDGDGIGDFRGVTQRLDYLEELGVNAIWILPFYPSPLRDDGYDIASYRAVNPAYGTLADFQTFLEEAHRRGIRVITELVINHTSDQHPWFQRARRAAPGTPERDFYVWSDDPDRYSEARIIFQDFEPSNWTWDPVAGAYYWHRFYHHQPDLNFDNPRVQEELFEILHFWLDLGVDGLRLDAIPYLYQREGTNCENLPETHAFLKRLREQVDRTFRNRMLPAEANQWPEDAAAYFGEGDECHMNFHFPLMPRLFMALRMEDRFPILDILEQTPDIPEGCQWALFLRNHDELTLEMVTDEERDYMYRVYAEDATARINLGIRRRLAPLLGNNRRTIELLNSLLFSLPGTPILYYGDEIGMGDNFYLGDRNGVRTPMQWSGDRNAGFSEANPQKLFLPVIIDPEYHSEAVNVEIQQRNPSSLLWWMRRLIGLRKRHQAFGRGTLEWVPHENSKVVAFLRRHEDETILVAANLSRVAQAVSLRLTGFGGFVPIELFGQNPFPTIREDPYPLSLPPHGFLWFSLESEEVLRKQREKPRLSRRSLEALPRTSLPAGTPPAEWVALLEGRSRRRVEAYLQDYVRGQRWFAGKDRTIRRGTITDVLMPWGDGAAGRLLLYRVEYVSGDPETYLLALTYARGESAERIARERPEAVAWMVSNGEEEGLVHDAMADPAFCLALLGHIAEERRTSGDTVALAGLPFLPVERILAPEEGDDALQPRRGRTEQSNTSVIFGERWIFKLFRRIEPGANPDREIGEFLREVGYPHSPELAGALELRQRERVWGSAGVLHAYVPNQGDAWSFTLDSLSRFFETALASEEGSLSVPLPGDPLGAAEARISGVDRPEAVQLLLGSYMDSARTMGTRTAQLHLALASRTDLEAFRPEPFSTLYQRSLYQSIRNLLGTTLESLGHRVHALDEREARIAKRILATRPEILGRFEDLLDRKYGGMRVRIHGDFHLGQLLYTGKDFQIIDFEGEPDRPVGERRIKRSPLRDVGGMIRSFDYAARTAIRVLTEQGIVTDARDPLSSSLARFWSEWASAEFLWGYLQVEGVGHLLPERAGECRHLLELFVLEKALYELRYEMNNRPDWARIPLEGILSLTGIEGSEDA